MTICDLCRSIPLEGEELPSIPSTCENYRSMWRYVHEFNARLLEDKHNEPLPTGFPFHPNLESLTSSAENCDLCSLILSAIENALKELNDPIPTNKLWDIPNPTWKLFLTKRREGGDGFWVFTECENGRKFCLVAAIGLCVKEGISHSIGHQPTS
jgi:hypothetical protein